MNYISTTQPSPCPECDSKQAIKRGKRHNRFQTFQVFQCVECLHRFTAAPGKHRRYPLTSILEAIGYYNRGYSVSQTQELLRRRLRTHVPERTIFSWLDEFRPYTSYGRLRQMAKKTFSPERLIRSRVLHHRQVYRFHAHQAKLAFALRGAGHPVPAQVARYLDTITSDYSHRFFTTSKYRASRLHAPLSPRVTRKKDYSTQMAKLVIPTSPSNKKRHETLQRFMLINDDSTVAVEVPVYLTPEDISYFKARGLALSFPGAVITGHIDFLQIRDGFVYILDYKPEARKQRHAHVQLTIYALALSRRANVPLESITCAWFDESGDYFEFCPSSSSAFDITSSS